MSAVQPAYEVLLGLAWVFAVLSALILVRFIPLSGFVLLSVFLTWERVSAVDDFHIAFDCRRLRF